MSAMARRLRLAVAMTSSWRHELPAATALAVAIVMPFVMRMKSSGVETLAGGTGEEKTCEARGSGERGVAGKQRGSRSTAHILTASSWRMCSIVASSARVPFVASSSTAFTVFSKEVTFVTIT